MVRRSADEATGEDTRAVVGFRAATVFDVAQTDGAELATPCHQLEGETSQELVLSLVRAIQAEGYFVESAGREEIGSANGDATPSLKRVRVAADLSPAQMFKTLAHELGHVLLHVDGGDQTCRGGRELEAESVAFIVSAAHGVDSSSYSFGYLAQWAGGTDDAVAGLRTSAERIAGRYGGPGGGGRRVCSWHAGGAGSVWGSGSRAARLSAHRAGHPSTGGAEEGKDRLTC